MLSKWAAYKAAQWQTVTIVQPGRRVHFNDAERYEQNYLAAHQHMMFFVDIARREGWRIVRGA